MSNRLFSYYQGLEYLLIVFSPDTDIHNTMKRFQLILIAKFPYLKYHIHVRRP